MCFHFKRIVLLLVAVSLSYCTAFPAFEDDCLENDPGCHPEIWLLNYGIEPVFDAVYVAGVLNQLGTGDDWWIKKYAPDGTEDSGWDYKSNLSGADAVKDITTDARGYVYAVGYRTNTSQDWWIKKFQSNGNEVITGWDKSLDCAGGKDTAEGVAVHPDGSIFVVGTCKESGFTATDIWIKRFFPDGTEDLNWNKQIGANNSNDEALVVKTDASGFVYVAGMKYNSGGSLGDLWLQKFRVDGSSVWEVLLDGGNSLDNERIQDIAIDASGNVYAVGNVSVSASNTDFTIQKFTSDGVRDTTNWNRTSGAGASDIAYAVELGLGGNVYVGGYGTVVAGPNRQWFLQKFKSDGTVITSGWNKTLDGSLSNGQDSLYSMVVSPAGHLYAVGELTQTATGSDWGIKKFRPDGTTVSAGWNKAFDGGNIGVDIAYVVHTAIRFKYIWEP